MHKIALIGNPNCGKTTLFNVLTGARQKVGNWPGVTVEKKFGYFEVGDEATGPFELVDLPGVYSLDQDYQGIDEKIAREFLDNGESDLLINVIDGTTLERGLVLTQQLLERDIPVIVAVNMIDVAAQEGIEIDVEALGEPGEARAEPPPLARDTGDEDHTLQRYHRSRKMVDGVVRVTPGRHSASERIDAIVLNRWLGIPIFLLMIYLMFTIAVNVGAVFIDFFDILFNALLVDGVAWLLRQIAAPEVVIILLANGVGGGITLVATFIPVIAFLYLCLSALEDSGYMSRAAFVIDRLMSEIGLPGNAFVPLIMGFGCNVPAVMATRAMHRDSDRLMTIAMAPFMSCGARLTVYALFAAAFFQSNGQNIVFGLYLLGIALAVFTGWIFRRHGNVSGGHVCPAPAFLGRMDRRPARPVGAVHSQSAPAFR